MIAADYFYSVTSPYWLLVIVFGALPVIQLARAILNDYIDAMGHRRRQREGLCRVCGYDLRATPQRCPECGAEPSVPSPTGRGSG